MPNNKLIQSTDTFVHLLCINQSTCSTLNQSLGQGEGKGTFTFHVYVFFVFVFLCFLFVVCDVMPFNVHFGQLMLHVCSVATVTLKK